MIGRPFEKASPLANPSPIRNPVNEPGPIETEIASILPLKKFESLINLL